jgi:uncharacterized protein (UPF0147 family)
MLVEVKVTDMPIVQDIMGILRDIINDDRVPHDVKLDYMDRFDKAMDMEVKRNGV